MPKCLVAFCKNNSQEKAPNVHYFRMHEKRYNSWMTAMGRDPLTEKLSYDNLICSEHFRSEDIIFLSKRPQLKKFAVPCLKLKQSDFVVYPTREEVKQEPESLEESAAQLMEPMGPSRELVEENLEFDVICKEAGSESIEAVAGPSSAFQDVEDNPILGRDRSMMFTPIHLEKMETSSATSTNSTISQTFPSVPKKPLVRKRKRSISISSKTDSEGLKGTPKKTRRLMRTFHNYFISPRKVTKTLKIVTAEKKLCRENSKHHSSGFTDYVNVWTV